MDKSEKYLKEIVKNTAEIAKELKRMDTKEASQKKLADKNDGGHLPKSTL